MPSCGFDLCSITDAMAGAVSRMLLVASGPNLILCSDTGFLFMQLPCLSFPPSRCGRWIQQQCSSAGSSHEDVCTKDKWDPFMLLRYSVFGVFSWSVKLYEREVSPSLAGLCSGSIVKGVVMEQPASVPASWQCRVQGRA